MKGLRLVTPISCILGSLMIFILNLFCCWIIASLYVGFVFFLTVYQQVFQSFVWKLNHTCFCTF